MEVDGDVARVWYVPYGPRREAHRHFAEWAVADVVVNAARVTPGLRVAQAVFAHEDAGDGGEVAGFLGTAVRFGGARTEVHLPREALGLPLAGANAALSAVLDQHARAQVARLGAAQGIAGKVRGLVAERLHEGDAGLVALA